METNDLKNIWKSGVEKNIRFYSEKELNEMVVKSTRKSLRHIYPSVFFIVVIAAIVYFIVNIMAGNSTIAIRALNLGFLLLIVVCVVLWIQSFIRMRNYETNMPIKNWLEYRIKEVEKSLNFKIKYNILLCVIGPVAALSYFYLFLWFSNVRADWWLIVGVAACIVVYSVFFQRYVTKNYKKTLKELKDLYKQFEE